MNRDHIEIKIHLGGETFGMEAYCNGKNFAQTFEILISSVRSKLFGEIIDYFRNGLRRGE